MQPQLRQMPPNRSRSITAVLRPSWAARIAHTYPPGPAPTTATSNVSMIVLRRLKEHRCRFFNKLLEGLQESRARRTVDDAVIARHGNGHDRCRFDFSFVHNGPGFACTNCKNSRVRRVDD